MSSIFKILVLATLIATPVTGMARNVNLPKNEAKAEKPMKACCKNGNHENDAAHSHGHAHGHGEGKACCMKQEGKAVVATTPATNLVKRKPAAKAVPAQ